MTLKFLGGENFLAVFTMQIHSAIAKFALLIWQQLLTINRITR